MNRYLEKIAAPIYDNPDKLGKTFGRRYLRKHAPSIVGKGLLGAAIGGGLGSLPKTTTEYNWKTRQDEERELSGFERGLNIAGGAVGGAGLGLGFGVNGAIKGLRKGVDPRSRYMEKLMGIYRKAASKPGASGGGGRSYSRYSSRTVNDLYKDLNASKPFKTKAEATRHYKSQAMKNHPDRGGSTEKMQDINKAWDEFKAHPDGFEKLASNRFLDFIADMYD